MNEDNTKPNPAWKTPPEGTVVGHGINEQGAWLMVAGKDGKIRHEWVEGANSDGGWVDGQFKEVQ